MTSNHTPASSVQSASKWQVWCSKRSYGITCSAIKASAVKVARAATHFSVPTLALVDKKMQLSSRMACSIKALQDWQHKDWLWKAVTYSSSSSSSSSRQGSTSWLKYSPIQCSSKLHKLSDTAPKLNIKLAPESVIRVCLKIRSWLGKSSSVELSHKSFTKSNSTIASVR